MSKLEELMQQQAACPCRRNQTCSQRRKSRST